MGFEGDDVNANYSTGNNALGIAASIRSETRFPGSLDGGRVIFSWPVPSVAAKWRNAAEIE